MKTYCYVAERPRCFRFDRIKTVYDDNGVVQDMRDFFEIFDLTIGDYTPPKKKFGDRLRKTTRDKVQVLIALSRIDGEMHETEIDEILAYAVKEVENKGYMQSEKDITAFEKYLRNLYPTPTVFDNCIERIRKYTDHGKEEFLQMCENVMNADDIQHETEFNLIMEIGDMIEG